MQFSSLAVLALAQLAVAQSSTATTSSVSAPKGTNLPDLVAEVDSCVLGCIRKVAPQVDCGSTDLKCLCSADRDSFISTITPCILTSGCNISAANDSKDKIGAVCDAVKDDPDQSSLDEAEKVLEDPDSRKESGSGSGSGSGGNDEGAAPAVLANGFLAAAVALILI